MDALIGGLLAFVSSVLVALWTGPRVPSLRRRRGGGGAPQPETPEQAPGPAPWDPPWFMDPLVVSIVLPLATAVFLGVRRLVG